MLYFNTPLEVEKILSFPKKIWYEEPTEGWVTLCNQLQEYCPHFKPLEIKNQSRKWELVSAYQKSVRRGLKERAMWLVAGFFSFPKTERGYFWKRICTTAAEDVGWANVELMNFTIACSQMFTPSTDDRILFRIWMFLTEKMCESLRSRIYCQLSIIESLLKEPMQFELAGFEKEIVNEINNPRTLNSKSVWAVKNNWRGEGMLRFQNNQGVLSFERSLQLIGDPKPENLIGGLPDFAYDKHTRLGKIVCIRLSGVKSIKELLSKYEGKKDEIVGWALFFAEGGYIVNNIRSETFDSLEHSFIAYNKFRVSLADWYELISLVREQIENGTAGKIRQELVESFKYV